MGDNKAAVEFFEKLCKDFDPVDAKALLQVDNGEYGRALRQFNDARSDSLYGRSQQNIEAANYRPLGNERATAELSRQYDLLRRQAELQMNPIWVPTQRKDPKTNGVLQDWWREEMEKKKASEYIEEFSLDPSDKQQPLYRGTKPPVRVAPDAPPRAPVAPPSEEPSDVTEESLTGLGRRKIIL